MDFLVEWLGSLPEALRRSVMVLGLFALAYVPLERAWAAREQGLLRPRWRTDLAFFFGQYWIFGFAAASVLAGARGVVGLSSPEWFESLPMPVQVVLVVVLGDLCVYWAHRAQHRFDLLWRFHAVHHTAEHLDWLAAHREHPLDGVYTQLAVNLPAMLLGFGVGSVMWLVTLRGMWAIFIHSNVGVSLGPFKVLLGAPELHHWHHARERHGANYGNLSPWTDLAFGTFASPPTRPDSLGVSEPAPRTYLGLLAWPFRRRR